MTSVAREVCAGWIGTASAAQFFTHIRFADEMPDMADIETNPGRAKLPAGRDAQMVCSYMLAHHLVEDNAQNIMRYVLRMVQEMQILAVSVISADPKRLKSLVPCREYQTWLMQNKDVLIASRS
jgi:hypothetical protein